MPSNTDLELNHVMIYVRDVDRSLRFYKDLGFKMIETMPGYARLRSPKGTSSIALHAIGTDQTFDPRREGLRLYFEVRDVDALCERLAAKGVPFKQMPKDTEWGWRHACLEDPDGHSLSLYWAGKKRFAKTQ